MPALKGVGEGVDVSTGVWSDSESKATAETDGVTDLFGMVIFGLGFSIFVGSLVEGPGLAKSTGSILIPPREETDGCGSESESESSILQMGRWASRTSSSLSLSFCNSAISFCRRDFSSSSWSVSYTGEGVGSREKTDILLNSVLRWELVFQAWALWHLCDVHSHFAVCLSAPGGDCDILLLPVCSSPSLLCVSLSLLGITLVGERERETENMWVTLDCETFLLWAKTNLILSNADTLRVPTDTHRWNTTTMCAQWVITLMAAEWLWNVWAFYAIVRSDFTQHSYWIIAADPIISRPFRAMMSHTQTPAVTQVWVTENDLPLWVTWHSTSCNMKLQLQEPNCDGWCVPTCAWWNQRITL